MLVYPFNIWCVQMPEVAISQRIHLCEGKSVSNQPCESSKTSPDPWGQELLVLVALWGRADVVTAGTLDTSVRQSAVLPETREGQVWVGALVPSVREETGCFLWTMQQSRGCLMLPRSLGSHRQEMFCCNPSWHVGSWSRQHTDCGVVTSGWPLVWITSVEVCSR